MSFTGQLGTAQSKPGSIKLGFVPAGAPAPRLLASLGVGS